MYTIKFTESSDKELKKLERDTQERIVKVLERIRIRPEDFVEKLVGEPGFKLRIGDYRIILDIDNKELIVLVIKIGNRRNIYKN